LRAQIATGVLMLKQDRIYFKIRDMNNKKPFQRITTPKSNRQLEMIRTQQILAVRALLNVELYS
jgi:hypothetical protein